MSPDSLSLFMILLRALASSLRIASMISFVGSMIAYFFFWFSFRFFSHASTSCGLKRRMLQYSG